MFSSTLALVVLVVYWYALVLFFISLVRRDNSIADIAWGPGIAFISLATLWWHEPRGLLPVVGTILVMTWGLRLAVHVWLRNWGRGEDWRYAKLRMAWGSWFIPRSFVQVFLLQGFLLGVVALPVLWINTFGGSMSVLAWIGVGVWAMGFAWESIADIQLTRFLKNPTSAGRILKSGLWKYSRHPNYFGEIAQWWGLWLMACGVAGGWATVLGPLLITHLIINVSGIPLLEEKHMKNQTYRTYAKQTNALIPWFPRKKTPTTS